MNTCPDCAQDLADSEICNYCGYDFNSVITCPFLFSNKCTQTNRLCQAKGMMFEDCNIYLKISGIKG